MESQFVTAWCERAAREWRVVWKDDGAATSADGDEVLLGELGEGAVDGASGGTELGGEFMDSGQQVVGGVGVIDDGVAQMIGDLVIDPGGLRWRLVAGR